MGGVSLEALEGIVTWARGTFTMKLFTTVCKGSRTWREEGATLVSEQRGGVSVTVVLTTGDEVDTADWLASAGASEVTGGGGEGKGEVQGMDKGVEVRDDF